MFLYKLDDEFERSRAAEQWSWPWCFAHISNGHPRLMGPVQPRDVVVLALFASITHVSGWGMTSVWIDRRCFPWPSCTGRNSRTSILVLKCRRFSTNGVGLSPATCRLVLQRRVYGDILICCRVKTFNLVKYANLLL